MPLLPAGPAPAHANGYLLPGDRDAVERKLTGDPLTQGYRPTLPLWQLYSTDSIPQFFLLRDVELMMTHQIVRSALEQFKGGIAGAEFWGGPDADGSPKGKPVSDSPEVSDFVLSQCHRYWDRGVPKVQGGYEYGWIGLEPTYATEDGRLAWTGCEQFSPRDVFLLTQNSKPVGVRVMNVAPAEVTPPTGGPLGGTVDLWTSSADVPAKGLWYVHNPRYSSFYGQSQLLGAWRPWRRLAWRDGAEITADGGIYRFAYNGPVVRYPEEDYQAPAGSPSTSVDSQGRPRRYARDMARQVAEQGKAGAGIGLSSAKYPQEMGGGNKWDIDFPKSGLNVEHIIQYIKYLIDQIRFGVGVPPELFEASETGSGYSGRSIPLEGFMQVQQRLADAILLLFVTEVLAPLVRWNFGPVPWNVEVRNLMETKRRAQMGKTPDLRTGAIQPQPNGLMNPSQPSPDGSHPVPGMGAGFNPPETHPPPAGFAHDPRVINVGEEWRREHKQDVASRQRHGNAKRERIRLLAEMIRSSGGKK